VVFELSLYNPNTFWSYRRLLNGIIDAGVLPNETDGSNCTPLDILIYESSFRRCNEGKFFEGVAAISLDLIESDATFSEEAMRSDTCLQSSLKVTENIARHDDYRIGTKNYWTCNI
jgi:hypothetical protein